jgi:hypothetical protein
MILHVFVAHDTSRYGTYTMLYHNIIMRGPHYVPINVLSAAIGTVALPLPIYAGPVTSLSQRLHARHCCGSEWWDSPTVLHAPLALNSYASRTETSLEPVVVCAQSSPDRRRTVYMCRASPPKFRSHVLFPSPSAVVCRVK